MIMQNVPLQEDGGELLEDYRCPFYRFYWASIANTFIEKPGSNTCGLKVVTMRANSPCEMENQEGGPCWALCGLNDEENRSVLEDKISDSGVCLVGGNSMSFREWYKEVTGEDFE
ncbi:hypothetical protein A3K73_00600 [Candidatus Pacearchaeota archaeon RBG_13_36_9]|nr:MAG: hypothetical protein A3K73_00600 [Candidatus Pacearchaeota archaeon RBG_13_36_9]